MKRDPVGLGDVVRATEGVQPWRRAFHCLGGVALVACVELGGVDRAVWLALLASATVAGLVLDGLRLTVPEANIIFFRWLSALVSPREARHVASSTWYAAGALLALALSAEAFAPAVLVMACADPAASVAGRTWGRTPLGKGTLEGTVAFYLVAVVVIAPFAGLGPAMAAALLVAALEVLPLGLDDNLTVPVGTVAALWVVEAASRSM